MSDAVKGLLWFGLGFVLLPLAVAVGGGSEGAVRFVLGAELMVGAVAALGAGLFYALGPPEGR